MLFLERKKQKKKETFLTKEQKKEDEAKENQAHFPFRSLFFSRPTKMLFWKGAPNAYPLKSIWNSKIRRIEDPERQDWKAFWNSLED